MRFHIEEVGRWVLATLDAPGESFPNHLSHLNGNEDGRKRE